MAWVIGAGNPKYSFFLAPNAAIRHWWHESFAPNRERAALGFSLTPPLHWVSNRIVSYNHGLEQAGPNGDVYTVDIRCEDVMGTGSYGIYRIGGGTLS